MQSCLQRHNLWGLIDRAKVTPPTDNKEKEAWMIKVGKVMFALKTTVEDDLLMHIEDEKLPKEIWDAYANLFKRRNDARLQLLENELLFTLQKEMMLGHFAQYCRLKKQSVERNLATNAQESDEEGDFLAFFANATYNDITKKTKEVSLIAYNDKLVDYKKDWIVESGCSNHITGDRKRLCNMSKYKGGMVVITVDNSKLPIENVDSTMIVPRFSPNQVQLEKVLHVPSMKKNLLSVSRLASSRIIYCLDQMMSRYLEAYHFCGPIMEG
ncbi:hypothetical protein GH714_030271 [Hevea brasiliensis]|uniref:Retrovirus-related Pol polyprotein from transposon TNT 1-94-like beta-barrel domain-containing protein n=1 Tax=Hevea brasiliensis TaxID=3981 RepID=A0A6A6LP57_HEVBR|nr:hypothetical protein GH714_030271 [Hevea brasiliensis]